MRSSLYVLTALALQACASAGQPDPVAANPPPATAVEPAIATLHRSRCGLCHVRVEPGTRTREALTKALGRHRTRLHLSDAQWAALIDYLAPG